MEQIAWRLVSPVGVPASETRALVSVRRAHTSTVGFLSNRKPNTETLQHTLAERMSEGATPVGAAFYQKANSAVGATAELLDSIGQECAVVVNGTGD